MATDISLLSLPDIVLVQILSHIPIQDLLQCVNRTCQRLHCIIENNSKLWKDISTDSCMVLHLPDLERLLRHSTGFESLLLPYADINCFTFELDFLFTNNLCNAKNLVWLDLSRCHLSTLCFLQHTKSLKILNVSECINLVDKDFEVISLCKELDQLWLSYNNILPRTISSVCSVLDLIVLDISGIQIVADLCENFIKPCMIFLQISLLEGQEDNLQILKSNHLDCSIRTVN